MTGGDFYLICSAVGSALVYSRFCSGARATVRLHLPHFHGHVGGHILLAMHGRLGGSPPLPQGGVAPLASNAQGRNTLMDVSLQLVTLEAFCLVWGIWINLLTRTIRVCGWLRRMAVGRQRHDWWGDRVLFSAECSSRTTRHMDSADYEMVVCWARFAPPL